MLLEQISKNDMKKYIKKYYNYAKKYLEIDKAPKIKFVENKKNADDFLGKTGFYNPDNMTIHLYVTDRHPKDIVRSFAHELIHHYQNLNEKLPKEILHKTKDADYASKDSHLRDMEREAFEKGNMMFRDWTDSLKVERENIMENKKLISKTDQRKEIEQKELVEMDPRLKEIFTEKPRVMEDHKKEREEIIFNELMRRFIK